MKRTKINAAPKAKTTTQLFREVSGSLERLVYIHSRDNAMLSEDLEGIARVAFCEALESYIPNMGTEMSTWAIGCAKNRIKDACRNGAKNRARFVPFSVLAGGRGDDEHTNEDSAEERILPGVEDVRFEDKELDDLLKGIEESQKKFLNARMAGYTMPEIVKSKLIGTRHQARKAEAGLQEFARKHILKGRVAMKTMSKNTRPSFLNIKKTYVVDGGV